MQTLLLCLLALVFVSASQYTPPACPQGQWECLGVSSNFNYVGCVNQVCKCRSDLGFAGNATQASPCNCPSPYRVFWEGGLPYCILYSDAVLYKTGAAREALLKDKIRTLYNSILWPAAASYAAKIAIGPSAETGEYFDLFAPDVAGVVDPLGVAIGFEGVAEYFIGSVWTGVSRVIRNDFNKLYADGDTVFINVDINFANYASPTATTPYRYYNLTQTGTFKFNSNNQIKSIDLVIRNVQLAVGVETDQAGAIQQLCGTILLAAGCNSNNDPNGAYSSFADCVSYMSALPFGTWDDVRQNTTICRTYHATLALLRPQVHCPHTGKTGGGKCRPHTAAEYYVDGRPE